MKYNFSIFIKLVITIIIEDINNRIGEWAIPQWRIDFTSSLRMLYLNNGSLIHCCICYFNIRQYDSQQWTQWIKVWKTESEECFGVALHRRIIVTVTSSVLHVRAYTLIGFVFGLGRISIIIAFNLSARLICIEVVQKVGHLWY